MITIRVANAGDLPALSGIYLSAFPDEDLVPLVRALSDLDGVSAWVAEVAGRIVGHVMFSTAHVGGQEVRVALLGPLAVLPEFQRQGVGTALIRSGVEAEHSLGVAAILVLGDPAYYGRHGFVQETRVTPPYPLPEEWALAWQSLALDQVRLAGCLTVLAPWQDPALWSS